MPVSYRSEDVIRTPERACAQIGYPEAIRGDNGSEFVSRDLDLWAYANDVTLDFSRPGKPTDNGFTLRQVKRTTRALPDPSSPSIASSGRSG